MSGYFGAGLTYDLQHWKGGRFFIQPTLGFNTSSVLINSVIENNKITATKQPELINCVEGFYLVRAFYQHVATGSATLIIGLDIRGRLPIYSPNYAAYAGINLSIDKITELFK